MAASDLFDREGLDPEEEDTASFSNLSNWYTNGGYNVIPWLELLDLGKWPLLEDDDDHGG